MKKPLIAMYMAASLLAANAFGQAKLIEKVERTGKEVVIPYTKFQLSNGLIVIVHEDHSDPLVHVDVTYHVGSAREEIGKSGFAHFFEHMMFQGSDHVADEQHFKIITEAGGTLNGTTNQDRTNYFETVPSNQLEKMLWLEADRMGFLLDAVTQQKFEVQRATVKNERGQRYDNVPYGLVNEVMAKNLYPYGHPYSWLTIGYIEDLNRVNVEDLKNFFLRWYGPNNAVLTVGGDVNTDQVVKLAEKYFGSIPRGPEVKPAKYPMPVLKQNRYVSMVDNYAKLPVLRVVFPGVPQFSKDEAALDCLAEILGQGKNSILYKNMVKTQKAVSAYAYNSTSELSGEFVFAVTPFQGQKLADMEKMVRQAIADFEKRGVTDDDITKFRNSNEARVINGLENVSGKVSQLAAFQTYTGDANYIGKVLAQYTSVTKADVMRVFDKYIKGKHSLVLSVLVKGQGDADKIAPDNYTVATTGYKAPDYGYKGLVYNKATDNFDRNQMPQPGANPVPKVPGFLQIENNGMKVITSEGQEIPVVTMLLEFKGGRFLEANNPDKAGLASLFTAMMEEDTRDRSAEAFSVELDKLGSSIDFSAGNDAISVNVRSLKKNFHKTIELLEERLLRPKFTEEAFETNKKRTIENIKNTAVRPNYIAGVVYNKILYGTDNVLGWPANGTEKTVSNITLADIQQYYDRVISNKDLEIVVVGDITHEEAMQELKFAEHLPLREVNFAPMPPAPAPSKTKIYFVDVPNAAQTEFRVGYVTNAKYDATGDFYKNTVMNYPLGGMFNSRLNLDLREDKGWTYGARSGFDGDKYTGSFTFSAGIKANATDSALKDILQIMKEYKETGVKPEELSFTQRSLAQSEARKYESGYQKAGFLARVMEYNLSHDFPAQQNQVLASMKKEDVNKQAKTALPDLDKMYIVLVGDKAKVWKGLQEIGYEMVELDREGNVLKK